MCDIDIEQYFPVGQCILLYKVCEELQYVTSQMKIILSIFFLQYDTVYCFMCKEPLPNNSICPTLARGGFSGQGWIGWLATPLLEKRAIF